MVNSENGIGRAEELAYQYLSGRLSSNECPDLSQLVQDTRNGKISVDDFVNIIDFHLKENDKMDKLNKEVL